MGTEQQDRKPSLASFKQCAHLQNKPTRPVRCTDTRVLVPGYGLRNAILLHHMSRPQRQEGFQDTGKELTWRWGDASSSPAALLSSDLGQTTYPTWSSPILQSKKLGVHRWFLRFPSALSRSQPLFWMFCTGSACGITQEGKRARPAKLWQSGQNIHSQTEVTYGPKPQHLSRWTHGCSLVSLLLFQLNRNGKSWGPWLLCGFMWIQPPCLMSFLWNNWGIRMCV